VTCAHPLGALETQRNPKLQITIFVVLNQIFGRGFRFDHLIRGIGRATSVRSGCRRAFRRRRAAAGAALLDRSINDPNRLSTLNEK
jgi:hypothetical protein